jgi:hypothetical protein
MYRTILRILPSNSGTDSHTKNEKPYIPDLPVFSVTDLFLTDNSLRKSIISG